MNTQIDSITISNKQYYDFEKISVTQIINYFFGKFNIKGFFACYELDESAHSCTYYDNPQLHDEYSSEYFSLVSHTYAKLLEYRKKYNMSKTDCIIIFDNNTISIKWTENINMMVAEQLNKMIEESYKTTLKKLTIFQEKSDKDKFSGVFMPVITPENINAPYRIMLVGRETNGWNTDNGKNTIHRVVTAIKTKTLDEILDDAKKDMKNK